jgi:tetratricopeptide (TPR) repeat protein
MTDNFRRGRRPERAPLPRRYDLVDTEESDLRLPSKQWPRWAWFAIAVSVVLVLASGLLLLAVFNLGPMPTGAPSSNAKGPSGADTMRAGDYTKRAGDYTKQGLGHTMRKEHAEAIKAYDEAIRLDPTYAAAYFYRSKTYRELGEIEQADADYKKAVSLDPSLVGK